MKLAPQPARRNPHAKRAPPNLSISARRSGAKLGAINPFRINTCESVSKQMTLSTFRINTYEKHRGRGVLLLTRIPSKDFRPERPRGPQGRLRDSHPVGVTRHRTRVTVQIR